MDAIILAAGKGTRLRPYTEKVPKPLLPVQGRPILDWILGALPPVDRLIVVVNYLGDVIEEYLATQTHLRHRKISLVPSFNILTVKVPSMITEHSSGKRKLQM